MTREDVDIRVEDGDRVSSVSFLGSSNHLLLVKCLSTVAVWDLDTRRETARLPLNLNTHHPHFGGCRVWLVETNDDCSLLAVVIPRPDADESVVELWEGFDKKPISPLRTFALPFCPSSVSFTSDGERTCFLSGGSTRTRVAVVLCLKTGRALQTLLLPNWVTQVVDADEGIYCCWNRRGMAFGELDFRLWMHETSVVVKK